MIEECSQCRDHGGAERHRDHWPPRPQASSPARLNRQEWEIRTAPLAVVRSLVEQHHYARGGSNTATFRHGLYRRGEDEALGAAWWIPPTRAAAESVTPEGEDWRGVINLSRLVVAPGVPKNAATFLLGASMRQIRRDGRFHTLLTYADEGQGHDGAIYRASNWQYLGTRPGDPVYLTPEGRMVARKAGGRTRTNQEMLDLGYSNTGRTRKHKFIYRLRRRR